MADKLFEKEEESFTVSGTVDRDGVIISDITGGPVIHETIGRQACFFTATAQGEIVANVLEGVEASRPGDIERFQNFLAETMPTWHLIRQEVEL